MGNISEIVRKLLNGAVVSRFVLRNHIYSFQTEMKAVAFTFDDGPSPETTRRLVDLFVQNGGKASFFFQGNRVEEYPDVVKYAHAHDFTIANHSYDHCSYDEVGWKEMLSQLRQTNVLLQRITGEATKFMRPPKNRITQWETVVVKARCDMHIVNANLAPTDWVMTDVEKLELLLLQNVYPGTIACLHDNSLCTVEALASVLPKLREKGYAFLSLDEMMKMAKPSPYRRYNVNYN